jgi:hypothetical protein
MTRVWSRPWVCLSVGAALVLGGGLLAWCWHFGVWSVRDWVAYQEMSRYPVFRDLHAGRIRQGQPVEEVIAQTHPVRVERFDNFVVLEYQGGDGFCFAGVTVVARDGRLVSAQAWSCTWQRTFFADWSAAERDAFWQTFLTRREARRDPA